MRAYANLGISGSSVEYLCFSASLSITDSCCVWNCSDWCSPDGEAELQTIRSFYLKYNNVE